MTYCNIIWGNAVQSTYWPIFRLQKMAIRIITNNKKSASTQPQAKKLNILSFPDLYTYSTTIFMYKHTHQMLPPSMNTLFQKNNQIHSYNTRNATKLRIPNIKTNLAEKFITMTGVNIWNQLSVILNIDQKISTFKQKLITHLTSKYQE